MESKEKVYVEEIHRRLVDGCEYVFNRGWQCDPPSFKSVKMACERLLELFPSARAILTMRHANLRILREMCLERGLDLLVPAKASHDVFRIPRSALLNTDGTRNHKSLSITEAMRYAQPYSGPVDLIVTGCIGFNPAERNLYLLGDDGIAGLIEEWRTRWLERSEDGQSHGFDLSPDVSVVALASDLQEVSGWPPIMRSFLEADLVITPTRTIKLGVPQDSTFNE